MTDPSGFLLGDMDPNKLSAKAASAAEASDVGKLSLGGPMGAAGRQLGTGTCPGCGFAFDDLKKTGRLGCSQCYQFFREEIKHNLGGMHKDTCHVGRVPAGMMEAFQNKQKIDQLQQEMNGAIANEDYEKAAALRDQLQKLSDENAASSEQ
ncbi:UvrB/UvrC motif-containing protein [Verrucomicrobiaceae bacterium R5-34]|uniref:UvrB/UvrC motif-containing protein n=1 Tax=Oceaniferula flava TaxID=2800421 RepID=A0AAE2SD43_9BACT|nr:UvrB/UvrC motif-containing protein [Oceaniferula flavus]MBK1831132.1 UvrB/UvrC motif-containing protein [Verrucomicrobiaceae bacterium R5-34]MBK1855649.1 UvrB/UvrC motif-containing protein [Oceaniferula flavus]MBM1136955.1 UvrB/UvrC motif-containing protein [Oceaniferula flavus]